MTTEPRVEELLATIRRAIDRDINALDARELTLTPAPQLRGTLQHDSPRNIGQPVRDAEADISSLRNRVQRHKLDTPSDLPKPVLRPVPSLYEPLAEAFLPDAEFAPEPVPYYVPTEPVWEESPQAFSYLDQPDDPPSAVQQPAQARQTLMSPDAAFAAHASFQALANAMMMQLGGDAGLQDKAGALLRPMLKQWLDANLPSLVERLVRDEIERVSRRGR